MTQENYKICKDCKQSKSIEEFSIANSGKCIQPYCKKCASFRTKLWYQKQDKKIVNAKANQRYKKNADYIANYRKTRRKLGLNTKEKEWYNRRAKTDLSYRLKSALRHRVYMSLKVKNFVKSKRTLQLLGCSISTFKEHIASKFSNGMTWENYGKWHIDHIIPCANFDLSKQEEQEKCFHFTNMQPLWAIDNIKKGTK